MGAQTGGCRTASKASPKAIRSNTEPLTGLVLGLNRALALHDEFHPMCIKYLEGLTRSSSALGSEARAAAAGRVRERWEAKRSRPTWGIGRKSCAREGSPQHDLIENLFAGDFHALLWIMFQEKLTLYTSQMLSAPNRQAMLLIYAFFIILFPHP